MDCGVRGRPHPPSPAAIEREPCYSALPGFCSYHCNRGPLVSTITVAGSGGSRLCVYEAQFISKRYFVLRPGQFAALQRGPANLAGLPLLLRYSPLAKTDLSFLYRNRFFFAKALQYTGINTFIDGEYIIYLTVRNSPVLQLYSYFTDFMIAFLTLGRW